MNINDIMKRDMFDAEREERAERTNARRGMTLAEYDREIRRRLWRRRLPMIGELIGGVVFFAMIGVLCLLCCAVSGYHFE